MKIKIMTKLDEKTLIIIDILDNLHTFFVHGYDTGFRVLKNYKKKKNTNDDEDIDCEIKQNENLPPDVEFSFGVAFHYEPWYKIAYFEFDRY